MADKPLVEQLKEKSKRRQITVRVPLWDIDVVLRELSVKERQEVADQTAKADAWETGLHIIARCCVEPTFTVDELRALYNDDGVSPLPLDFLADQAMSFSKLYERAVADAENSFPDSKAGK